MMPIASFLALNIYHEPTILVLGGQSTSFYVIASINILYSSAIPIFHITQLALFIASCKVFGSKISALSILMEKHQIFFYVMIDASWSQHGHG